MSEALRAPGVGLDAAGLIGLRGVALAARGEMPLSALPGGFVTRRRGHGQEVADVRDYVAGDDIRHLDRGSTARTGRLHVRQFQEERDRVSLLVADFRPAMLWGTRRAFRSVAAAEALALIGWRVVEEGGRVGLLALGAGPPVAVPPRGRARGMLEVIGGLVRAHEAALALALTGADRDPPLEAGLARLERIAPRGAELVIASGFDAVGPGFDDRIAALGRGRVPRLLAIRDGGTARLPRGSYPIRLPDGSRARARIDGGPAPAAEIRIAGLAALALDAATAPAALADRLAAAFPADREP
ncbi:DUF58 domain-containing protein [Roseivivax sp. CAU 1761]